jgi:putative spermidine/putrescine transport system substrate-binding protein
MTVQMEKNVSKIIWRECAMFKNMKAKYGAFALAFSVCLFTANVSIAAERSITVVSWGGAFQEAQRETMWTPYSKATGVKIVEDSWNGSFGKIRAMVESKSVHWDLIWGDYAHAIIGCEAGILEPIRDVIDDESDFEPGVHHECGISTDLFSALMAYDSDKIPASWGGKVPMNVVDAFDVKKFPGKRALRKRVSGLFETVLMSTGVAPEKVYETLGTDAGIDRVLNKLESIKDSLVWFKSSSQSIQLLADGEVSLSYTYNGRVHKANEKEKRNFKMIWSGQTYSMNTAFVPKGGNVKEAKALLKYALKKDVLARYSSWLGYGPTRKSAVELVDAKVQPILPNYPANLKTALLRSEDFWADNKDHIDEKFTVWLAKQ